jgi:phosphomannomutase
VAVTADGGDFGPVSGGDVGAAAGAAARDSTRAEPRIEAWAELRTRAEAWLVADPDPRTRAELATLIAAGDTDGLRDRFAHPLRFGTAGLRATLGAGPARMNRAVVRRTTAGLARWVLSRGPAAAASGVVVGRDARHGSAAFATDVADVLTACGIAVQTLVRPLPTPITAFAVRRFGAAAGVMITASHNPAADNGYKVYAGDGAQIIPPDDAAIAAAADEAGPVPVGAAPSRPGAGIDDEVLAAYREAVLGLIDPYGPRGLRVVYTPLHGVGGAVLPGLLGAAGFDAPVVVAEQADPDPDFPTVAFPNPEEVGALDLALAAARRAGADVVLANDPDADRLAVAVPDRDGRWRVLTGDELGILLAARRLEVTSGPGRLVATTVVSSTMLSKLAAEVGVAYEETLTGFKWIARAARRRPGHRLVFGYEEALGFAIDEIVADKDGLSAALVTADLAAQARAEGQSLLDRLDALSARLGLHATAQWSRRAEGPGGIEELARVVAAWRRDPPTQLGGLAVTEVVDLSVSAGGLPPTDALVLRLGARGRVVLRPSGTEPKLKAYLEATTDPPGLDGLDRAKREAGARLDTLRADVAARCRAAD